MKIAFFREKYPDFPRKYLRHSRADSPVWYSQYPVKSHSEPFKHFLGTLAKPPASMDPVRHLKPRPPSRTKKFTKSMYEIGENSRTKSGKIHRGAGPDFDKRFHSKPHKPHKLCQIFLHFRKAECLLFRIK